MNTLNSPPLAPLLKQLFADDERSSASMRRGSGPSGTSSADNYIEFFSRLKDMHLAIAPETGRFLYMAARAMRARAIVEFGTSFGISTLFLAAAIKDNGGGKVISTEFEPSKIANAQANLDAGGVSALVEIRAGDALQTLAKDLPDEIDLVLLDGAKPLYVPILRLLEPRLRSGALVVADNSDMCPDYVAYVRAATDDYLTVPFGSDVELSMRL